jgi:hypothetical protein
MLITALEQILNDFGAETVALLRKNHEEAGQVASGNALNSFAYELVDNEKIITLTVNGANYSEYLDRGRGTGKQTPVDSLLNWMNEKGVAAAETEAKKKGIAFAIARKHAQEGSLLHRTGRTYNGKQSPITAAIEQERLNVLNRLLEENLIIGIESEALEIYRTGKL